MSKTFIYWILCINKEKQYYYGKIEGYNLPCRKHKITGNVQAKYRNKGDYLYSIDAWCDIVTDEHDVFIKDPI